jgi:hypothetical protein
MYTDVLDPAHFSSDIPAASDQLTGSQAQSENQRTILQGPVRSLKQEPRLRIHGCGFWPCNREEWRVECADVSF